MLIKNKNKVLNKQNEKMLWEERKCYRRTMPGYRESRGWETTSICECLHEKDNKWLENLPSYLKTMGTEQTKWKATRRKGTIMIKEEMKGKGDGKTK